MSHGYVYKFICVIYCCKTKNQIKLIGFHKIRTNLNQLILFFIILNQFFILIRLELD